jgi:DNA primase
VPQDVIDQILEQTDIVEVVGSFVPLKKAGGNYVACCPFHQEKTPSFSVSRSKRIFKCFGCGVGGNVITFLMKIENKGFPQVIQELAGKAGIRLPDDNEGLGILFEMHEEACRFYFEQLKASQEALKYLESRKISLELQERYRMGLAPDEWAALLDHMYKVFGKLEDTVLSESGLFSKSSRGTWYDKFRNRILFPIMDRRSRVIGFGGRVFNDAASGPKYLNSPETILFEKGKNLYNLNQVQSLKGINTVLVVEGYMDVIGLASYGFPNAVAPLGTGFTRNQVQMLEKDYQKVILIFDGDDAGSAATLRAIERFVDSSMVVLAVRLPNRQDPKEYLDENGREAFVAQMKQAQSAARFYCEEILSRYNLEDRASKRQAYKEIREFFKSRDPLFLQGDECMNQPELFHFLEQRFEVDESILREQLLQSTHTQIDFSSLKKEKYPAVVDNAMKLMLRMMNQNDLRCKFLQSFRQDEMEHEITKEMYSFLEREDVLSFDRLLIEGSSELGEYLSSWNWETENISGFRTEEEALYFFRKFKLELLQDRIESLGKRIRAEESMDKRSELMHVREALRQERRDWQQKYS